MKPKRIILIRHGESEGNVNESVYVNTPDWKIALTPTGMVQAVEAGKKLKELVGNEKVHAYVSPYTRTMQTYEGIIEHLQPSRMYQDPRLREQDWGHFRARDATEIIKKERDNYGSFLYRFPDGESGADVYDRATLFIDTLWRDFNDPSFDYENVLIVTHGLTMRLFAMRWFHWTMKQYEELANPKNCEIKVMSLSSSSGAKAIGKARYQLDEPFRVYDKSSDPIE